MKSTIGRHKMQAPFGVGDAVFLRKITMILTGRVQDIQFDGSQWWVSLTHAAWIADTGRYARAVATGVFNEVEPYPDDLMIRVPLGDLVDGFIAPWDLPRTQK
jgi:hypothetical protein